MMGLLNYLILILADLILHFFIFDSILVYENFFDVLNLVAPLPNKISQLHLTDMVQIVEVKVVYGNIFLLLAEGL